MSFKLLRHPKPYEYENLANYLERLSEENCCKKELLLKEFKIPIRKSHKSINEKIKVESIKLISNATNKDESVIKGMMLNQFDLWKNFNDLKGKYFFKEYIKLDTSKYCPLCLKENRYQRLYWQLQPISICLKHNIILLEHCIKCNKILTIEEINNGTCRCGADLSRMPFIRCYNSEILNIQLKIYEIFGITKNNYECQFFSKFKRNTDFIEFIVLLYWLIDLKKSLYSNLEKKDIKMNGSIKVFSILFEMAKVLKEWPYSFHSLIKDLSQKVLEVYEGQAGVRAYKLYNPINCIYFIKISDEIINNIVYSIDFLYKELLEVFKIIYNSEYILKLFKKDIEYGKYIDYRIVGYKLSLSIKDEDDLFQYVQIDNKKYIDIDEILKYFNIIRKNSSYLRKEIEKCISIKDVVNSYNFNSYNRNKYIYLKNLLKSYKYNPYEIGNYISVENLVNSYKYKPHTKCQVIKVIIENGLKVKINPLFMNYGINVIWVPKHETMDLLFELL